ncbi:MBL fold metallo-hydrolase [uncultured Clostridium sp.]|uniref:MBL fold metallo-hydrolase n=2 Tax=uncultured Clostridium sp. TaxID=59620 RepID=UPI0025EEEBCF|nr:MBL fold metallo-hydrolase [uncultured Clostridium sp.]
MIVTSLVDNIGYKQYKGKHGLCFYIKTKKHNILFDVGPNNLYIKNAEKAGINISDIDIVVISHGHYDHGGGLQAFLKINKKAKIYINKNSFDPHYVRILKFFNYSIGLDKSIKDSNQVILTDSFYKIDDELIIYLEIKERKLVSKNNDVFYTKKDNKIVKDKFKHEQYLIISEDDKAVLFSGCSHRGIVNIIEEAKKINTMLDIVIGGLHLYNPVLRKYETTDFIDKTAEYLKKQNIMFYTCHCTGVKAYELLKNRLGSQIEYLKSGDKIEI